MYVFKTFTEVRELTENWIREHNDERPHDSLNDLPPWEYLVMNTLIEDPPKIGRFTLSVNADWRYKVLLADYVKR